MVARRYKTSPNGVYRWMFDYIDPETKERRREKGKTTKAEAELAEKKDRLRKYTEKPTQKFTVNELGKVWITQQHHLAESSLAPLANAWELRVQPYWGDRDITEITRLEVRDWVGGLKNSITGEELSQKTKINSLSVLKRIIDDGIASGANIENPCVGIKIKKDSKKPIRFLTKEQLIKFADTVTNPDRRLMVYVLGLCGLRWGEAVALRGRHLDLKRNRIRVETSYTEKNKQEKPPKNNKIRTVPVPKPLMKELARLAEKRGMDNLLWPNRKGTYLSNPSSNSNNWFASARKRSGVPYVSPHDLRHTTATIAISNGANVKVVQEMLGHSSAAMTLDIYAGFFPDDLDQISEKMGEGLVI